MNSKLFHALRAGFALTMVGLLGWVIIDNTGQVAVTDMLGARFGLAVVLGIGGLFSASMSWSSLTGTSGGTGLAAFGSTLPLRHLPLGGLGQTFGLTSASRLSGVAFKTLVQATPLYLATTAGGASLVAVPLVWNREAPWWLRLVVLGASVATIMLIWGGQTLLGNLLRRRGIDPAVTSSALARSTLWSTLAALGAASAFSLLFPFAPNLADAISGWSAAWLCGFLFVIAPAGLGVREAVMLTLWPDIAAPTVVAAALTHRLSTLAAEGVLFIISWRLTKQWLGSAGEEAP